MTRWIKLLIALVAVAAAGWQINQLAQAMRGDAATGGIETALVEKGSFAVGIAREGTVESADTAQVQVPQSGSVLTWVIAEGTAAKQGTLLAKVDVSDYKFEVDQQRLESENRLSQIDQVRRDRERDAESARMNVDKTIRAEEMLGTSQATETGQGLAQVGFDRWRLNWAETDYDKQERLFEAGINPQSRVEQAQRVVGSREYDLGRSEKDVDYLKATHDSDRAQLGADLDAARYEANLAQTRIDEAIFSAKRRAQRSADRLADMEKQLAGGEIRAPKAGLVVLGTTWDDSAGGRRKLREGDRVWPGMRIATITNLSDVQVTVPVEDTVISQVKIGQETVIRAVGNEEREFTGRVASVGPMARRMMRWESANARADQRVFDVVVTINRPDLKLLRPGTKVQIQFVRARLQHIVSVPLAAVFDKPGGRVVYVERGGRFTPRRVEIGERNDQAVEIRRGIRAGERIAISDPTLWEMP